MRLRENDFRKETRADAENERDHKRFDVAKSLILEIHHGQHVQRGFRHTPQSNGILKSKLSAMAEPMTSARSQAHIAISHKAHSAMLTGLE